MPKTIQYQQWAKPLVPATADATPAGVAEWAARNADPPRRLTRLTPEPVSLFRSFITSGLVPAPDGTGGTSAQNADPPRPVRRLTCEPVSLFVAWPVPARAAVDGNVEWLVRNEELPDRLPRLVQEPASRYVPESIDSTR